MPYLVWSPTITLEGRRVRIRVYVLSTSAQYPVPARVAINRIASCRIADACGPLSSRPTYMYVCTSSPRLCVGAIMESARSSRALDCLCIYMGYRPPLRNGGVCAHCCGSQPLRHIADKPSVIAHHYSATSVVSQPSRPSACARVHSGPL